MALTDVGLVYYPSQRTNTRPGQGSGALNAADKKWGTVFQAPKTGSIRNLSFVVGATSVNGVADVRLETVSTSTAFPTGTLWGTGTRASYSLTSAEYLKWVTTVNLDADAVVTKGDILALVISNPSSAYANSQVQYSQNRDACNLPYLVYHNGTIWSNTYTSMALNCGCVYSDGSTPKLLGIQAFSYYDSYVSASATLWHGNRITLPFKCRAIGFWSVPWGNGIHTYKLFGADGVTVLGTVSHTLAIRGASNFIPINLFWPSPITLEANTTYRLAAASDGTNNKYLGLKLYTTANLLATYEHSNGMAYASYATNPSGLGSWTDENTKFCDMGLIIDQIDFGGGLLLPPSLTGGFHRG